MDKVKTQLKISITFHGLRDVKRLFMTLLAAGSADHWALKFRFTGELAMCLHLGTVGRPLDAWLLVQLTVEHRHYRTNEFG